MNECWVKRLLQLSRFSRDITHTFHSCKLSIVHPMIYAICVLRHSKALFPAATSRTPKKQTVLVKGQTFGFAKGSEQFSLQMPTFPWPERHRWTLYVLEPCNKAVGLHPGRSANTTYADREPWALNLALTYDKNLKPNSARVKISLKFCVL